MSEPNTPATPAGAGQVIAEVLTIIGPIIVLAVKAAAEWMEARAKGKAVTLGDLYGDVEVRIAAMRTGLASDAQTIAAKDAEVDAAINGIAVEPPGRP